MSAHRMDKYRNEIKKHAVRLETGAGTGTGFLFFTEESEYVYIFTALHVVLDLFVRDKEGYLDVGGVKIPAGELAAAALYPEVEKGITDGEYDRIQDELNDSGRAGREFDAVVIRAPRDKVKTAGQPDGQLYWMDEKDLPEDFSFLGFGYPDGKEFSLELYGNSKGWNGEGNYFDCQAEEITYEPFADAVKGYSGTGLITEYQESLILTGFVIWCPWNEKHRCFCSVGISEIIRRMEEKGWETPPKYGKGVPPDTFLEIGMRALEQYDLQYMEREVSRGIQKEFFEIARRRTPRQLAKERPPYDVPVCDRERLACANYWEGCRWTLLVGHMLADGPRLEYICSEGEGNADIASVIASVARSGVIGGQITEDCILIWQSRKNPSREYYTRRKFKNIVANIADGRQSDGDGQPPCYDLVYGEMSGREYGICHVNHLIHKLEECGTMEETRDAVREALDEIWR